MVKIKAGMSVESSDGESEALAAVRGKLKIQQRLIDISARSLLSSRSSTADLSQSFESQSALEVQRENSSLQETRLMKFFSRQLLLKHMFLRQCPGNACAEREIDDLIDLGLFLSIADLQPRSVQLLKEEQLSLDGLFALSSANLGALAERLGLAREEEGKLKTYLNLLACCYNQLEREASEKGFSYDRYCSSSSRLSSVSTPGSLDERHDSISSIPSSAASLAPAGSVFTLLSPRAYSTTTVASTPSLLSPSLFPTSPCPPHLPNGGAPYHSTPRPLTPTSQSPTLSRNTSLSSSQLLQEQEAEPSEPAQRPARVSHSYLQQRHSHMRSHSNPHAHLIAEEAELRRNSPAPPPEELRSPSPPHRTSSQSSVAAQGSPSPALRRPHHLRRPHPLAPGSSHISGGEQLAPESPVLRSSAYSSSHYDYPVRSNSLTYTERRASSMSYQTHGHQHSVEGVGSHSHGAMSTSMVDLPMNYAASSEYLGDIEEYPLSSNSAKSQSVPKLTLLTISTEDKNGSTSVPTSPRSPGAYTPTGHMGHAIKHRFTAKTFLTPHVCTVCKKTMILGVRCKHCHYRCHKGCADKAPHSCGLPRELMNFFRQQYLKKGPSSSFDSPSSSEPYARRPTITRGQTYDADTRETAEEEFIIPELSKEPAKGQYSPVMSRKTVRESSIENGRRVFTQPSSTSLLEVPAPASRSHHGGYHSVSSSPSPSSSPPSSPSLTPSTPRSPRSPYPVGPAYPLYSKIPDVTYTDESENESLDGEQLRGRGLLSGSQSPTSFASKDSISDLDRMRSASPKGLRPPPQVVPAHSLPDLLLGQKSEENSEESSEGSSETYSPHQTANKKASIVSATESHASTLINSYPSQADDDDAYSESYDSSQGMPDEYPRKHRNSVVDEWNIPYDEVKLMERVGRGPLGEVFKGYWHGQVAIKTFCLDNDSCSKRQLHKLREEVSILKKTRHQNLALFMGASLTPPNLAIITSFCRGNTLHKRLHVWSETFSLEKSINISKQIATGMGYLHARGILHKGLHSRNVFLDKEKVVITDTGLSSVSDSLCCPNQRSQHCMVIPRTKLNYMAPELMREIRCSPPVLRSGDIYHYSEKTDIYAFGTVFYELLTRRYPCPSHDNTGFPIDVTMVIYQVGRGYRQDISARDAPKRIKDLVWDCWQLNARKRPPFSTIWDILCKVLRRKTPIGRSPSVPTALSRSSEDLLKLSHHL